MRARIRLFLKWENAWDLLRAGIHNQKNKSAFESLYLYKHNVIGAESYKIGS